MKPVLSYLKQQIAELRQAQGILQYSYEKCYRIGFRVDLSAEELESFEALTSRFARLSDIITQKVFKAIDIIDLEESGTVRDRINRAEKKGLIDSADDFIEIRILRNEITHEYKPESVYAIFEKVLEFTPMLLKTVNLIEAYLNKYQK